MEYIPFPVGGFIKTLLSIYKMDVCVKFSGFQYFFAGRLRRYYVNVESFLGLLEVSWIDIHFAYCEHLHTYEVDSKYNKFVSFD